MRWNAKGVGVAIGGGGRESWSVGIDDFGFVSGTREAPEDGFYRARAFRWERSGRIVDYGPQFGGEAVAASSRGNVAGWAKNDDGRTRTAARWDVRGTLIRLESFGGPGGLVPEQKQVNNAGVVIGSVNLGYSTHAIRWDAQGLITELPGLGDGTSARAVAVNDRGLAVGYSYTNADDPEHALLWRLPGNQ